MAVMWARAPVVGVTGQLAKTIVWLPLLLLSVTNPFKPSYCRCSM